MKRILLLLALCLHCLAAGQQIVVGSKKFPESNVLGEIAKKVISDAGLPVQHKEDIGSTGIVWSALTKGDITLYPEYTGTIIFEILKQPGLKADQIGQALAKFGVGMSKELGFNDTYGLVMRRKDAERLKITKYSDLKAHTDLRCGITHELMGRKDGWTPLLAKYGLTMPNVQAIDHALGYAALFADQIDVKDCYTTDAEIQKYDLVVLEDDLHFFPLYRAVFLYRLDMPKAAVDAINALANTIPDALMIRLNGEANKSKDYSEAASLYFNAKGGPQVKLQSESRLAETLRLTGQHLVLVGISLSLAILVGLPLGIRAARPGTLSGVILSVAGIIQTIPSLALLALLVPLPFFGIGKQTAITALFLYSLLPIIRNTATGLQGIPPGLRESAEALGMSKRARMVQIYLPMALPYILAGIKTSAVINVGTATIAALIGADGLGKPIITGLSLNDNNLVLWGAIPAAILALLVQFGFDGLERLTVSRGLRIR